MVIRTAGGNFIGSARHLKDQGTERRFDIDDTRFATLRVKRRGKGLRHNWLPPEWPPRTESYSGLPLGLYASGFPFKGSTIDRTGEVLWRRRTSPSRARASDRTP